MLNQQIRVKFLHAGVFRIIIEFSCIKMLLAIALAVCCLFSVEASITEFIDKSDRVRLYQELTKSFVNISKTDFSTPYYGAKGFSLLNEPLPQVVKLDTCAHYDQNFKENNPESIFYALSVWSQFSCAQALFAKDKQLHTAEQIKALKIALEKSDSTTTDIRYSLEALKFLGESIPNQNQIAQLLQARIKEDDSLQSIGQALHAAALLGNAGQFANQYVEDVIVQADEVDGRMLQWEGGLSVTGLLLTGLLKLPGGKALTQVQADKFATYLLTRKTVQNPRGVLALVESALALSKSNVSPVCITFFDTTKVTTEKPELKIRICDIFGTPLKPTPSSVVAQSATRTADDVVVLSKQPLTPGKETTEFILPLKLEPGQYRVGLTAGSHSAAMMVRVLGPVTLKWLEVGLVDADGSSAPRLTKLQYPGKLGSSLQADSSQHLVLRYSLSRPVHQTFLRLSTGKKEIIFVGEQDSNEVYKIEVNLLSQLSYSASFQMELILGDSIMSNPIRWEFGNIEVKLGGSEPQKPVVRGPRPEIKHMFRPAEKRPPQLVSVFFTALAASPLLLLLILWLKIGINLKNFSIAALAFHLGLGGIFGLFVLFWLKLDMFTTCGWLLPLGGFTFLAGHHILSKLAKQKK